MACFGCSRQLLYENDVTKDFEEVLVKNTGSLTKKKKKKSWISWFRPKKSAAKTVPVSLSMSGNLDASSKSHLLKLDKVNAVLSKKHRDHTGVNASNKTYKKKSGTVKEIILENNDINHLTSLARGDRHDKKHSSRKKETNKNGSSPTQENRAPPTAANRADLISLPQHREKKTESIKKPEPVHRDFNGTNDNASVKNQNREALDSIVGMSIIVVVLALILFWGVLCAILCTSACFYIIPRLRMAADSNAIVNNALEPDVLNLNSDEHKKKVVLEGLLHRDHRSVIGLL